MKYLISFANKNKSYKNPSCIMIITEMKIIIIIIGYSLLTLGLLPPIAPGRIEPVS